MDEKRDILASFAQRRDMDAKEVEPIVKVLPKRFPLHRSAQFNVRRGDESDIDENVCIAAEPREFARFQHPEELHLRFK